MYLNCESDMLKCEKCGVGDMLEISRNGPQANCRCVPCGHETWFVVYDGTYGLDGSWRSTEPFFLLTGRWTPKPTVKQVLDVQELFPQLKDAGFSALWRQAVAHEEIRFGLHSQDGVTYLADVLRSFGLETTQYDDPMSAKAR